MAASTATPFGTSRPLASGNPTSTEHDFRFPRRPNNSGVYNPDSPSNQSKISAGDLGASLRDLGLELDAALIPHHDGLLRSSLFPSMQNGLSGGLSCIAEMQKNDPIGASLWLFFAKAKMMLPQQQRMENLSWRKMHMNLRKSQREAEKQRGCQLGPQSDVSAPSRIPAEAMNGSQPSSTISLLRKESENDCGQKDAMSLDDFIESQNLANTPSPEKSQGTNQADDTGFASAIPIKSRKSTGSQFVPQSVPAATPYRQSQHEFHYVRKHHRKTSIDERRVSSLPYHRAVRLCFQSHQSSSGFSIPSPLPSKKKRGPSRLAVHTSLPTSVAVMFALGPFPFLLVALRMLSQ